MISKVTHAPKPNPQLDRRTRTTRSSDEWFDKLNPANGQILCKVARSRQADILQAIEAAKKAQPAWADTPAVQRGMILHKIVVGMQNRQSEIAPLSPLKLESP